MRKVKVGIFGAGRIGKVHADTLLRLAQADIRTIVDPFADAQLEAWAAERGIPRVAKDSSAILEDPDIEAVFICSSTNTHISLMVQAAEAGKHIFCEKPISMEAEQSMEALERVRQSGVKLQIGFNRRFDHNFRRVRDLVQEGRIGQPHVIKITSRDPSPPPSSYIQVSGGIFMDMMIHDFDMAKFLAGSEVVEVYAFGGVMIDPVFAEHRDLDTAIATLRFANGAIGVIDNSRQAVYGYDQRVEVFGSAGAVTASNDYPNTVEVSGAACVDRDKPLSLFLDRYRDAYFDEAKAFIECVTADSPVPVTGDDGLQAELCALAAGLSVKLGRAVKIAEVIGLKGTV